MPRIAHVTTISLTLGFFRGHARTLAEHGWTVFGISGPGEIPATVPDGVDFEHVAVPLNRRIEPLHDAVSLLRLIVAMRRLDLDVVHTHTQKGTMLGQLAAIAARVPVRVYTVHGWRADTGTDLQRALFIANEHINCRLAHRVFVVSPSVARKLEEHGCVAPGSTHMLGSGSVDGVDATGGFDPDGVSEQAMAEARARCGLPAGVPVVGFVGRLTTDKGVAELVEVWRAISERHPDAWLLAVGDTLAEEEIDPDVLDFLTSHPRVAMPGMVRGMAPWYALMDVIAFPSKREGFPVVVLEAQAMRVPVVGFRVTGVVDSIVDGVTGALLEYGDVDGMIGRIDAYLSDPDLRAEHGQAARQRCLDEFDPTAIREAMVAEYEDLLRTRGR